MTAHSCRATALTSTGRRATRFPSPVAVISTLSTTKSVAGHFVHIFNSTTTNELIATWGYGNFPVGPKDISTIYKTTLGYPYGSIFNGSG